MSWKSISVIPEIQQDDKQVQKNSKYFYKISCHRRRSSYLLLVLILRFSRGDPGSQKKLSFPLESRFFWSLEVDKQELQERKVLLYDDDRLLNSVAVLGVVKTKKESVEHFSLIIVKRCRNYWVAHHCRKWILTKDKKEEEQQHSTQNVRKHVTKSLVQSETGTNFWHKRVILNGIEKINLGVTSLKTPIEMHTQKSSFCNLWVPLSFTNNCIIVCVLHAYHLGSFKTLILTQQITSCTFSASLSLIENPRESKDGNSQRLVTMKVDF